MRKGKTALSYMSMVVLASRFRDSLFGKTWSIGNRKVKNLSVNLRRGSV